MDNICQLFSLTHDMAKNLTYDLGLHSDSLPILPLRQLTDLEIRF